MKILTMRRTALLCAGLGAVGAISAVAFTGTNAQYSAAQTAQQNNVTSGTVSFNNEGGTVTQTLAGNLAPGDSLNTTNQRYYLQYTGSLSAFIGVDMTVTSTAAKPCPEFPAVGASVPVADLATKCQGTGEQPLFGGTSAADLNLTAQPGATGGGPLIGTDQLNNSIVCSTVSATPGIVVQCASTVANVLMPFTGNPGYADPNDHSKGLGQNAGLIWPSSNYSTAPWVSIAGTLDSAVGNQTQGSKTSITLSAHAVQSANNTGDFAGATGTCGSTTINSVSYSTQAPDWGAWQTYLTAAPATLPCPISWG